jgi:hypothetical protein
MPPGSLKGLQLVVPDIHNAHARLAERGVQVSDLQVFGESPNPDADPLDNVGFVFFSDPARRPATPSPGWPPTAPATC